MFDKLQVEKEIQGEMNRKLWALGGAALGLTWAAWAGAQPPANTTPPAATATPPVNAAPPARQQLAAAGRKGPAAIDPEAAARGKQVFQSNCSFCHGANAKGGESGPDLLRSELTLHDANGDKIGPVVHGSRADKGMPKFTLTDEQIADISAFLHQRVKAAAVRGTYQILNIVTGDPKKGEAYFNAADCPSCHSVTGDLAHIGSKTGSVELQQEDRDAAAGPRRSRLAARPPKDSRARDRHASLRPNRRGTLDQQSTISQSPSDDDSGEYALVHRNGQRARRWKCTIR